MKSILMIGMMAICLLWGCAVKGDDRVFSPLLSDTDWLSLYDYSGSDHGRSELMQAALRDMGSTRWEGNVCFRTGEGGGGGTAEAEPSFMRDLTAVFRPSRWAHPLSEGGPLSWVNPWVWQSVPYRTMTVLIGEVVVFGVTYAVVDGSGGGHGSGVNNESAGTTPTTSGSSGSSHGSSSPESAGTTSDSGGGGGSSGGGSTGGGGDESPF